MCVCVCVCWQDDCEAELSVAMPLLESALAALDTLSKPAITEMRAMKNPPQPVKRTMEAVCQLLGVKPRKVSQAGSPGKACACSLCCSMPVADCSTQKRAVSEGMCVVLKGCVSFFALRRVRCAVQVNDPNDTTRKLDDYWTPSQVRVSVCGCALPTSLRTVVQPATVCLNAGRTINTVSAAASALLTV